MTTATQCFECANYYGGLQCQAFPREIPVEIVTGEYDHQRPHPDDHGVRFEPIKKKVKAWK